MSHDSTLNGRAFKSQSDGVDKNPAPARGRSSPRPSAKELIRGRELELLAHRGVDVSGLKTPNSHIICPFPNHTDARPSWRWDRPTARYQCTCGSGDIFEALKNLEGWEFAEAARYIETEFSGESQPFPFKGKAFRARSAPLRASPAVVYEAPVDGSAAKAKAKKIEKARMWWDGAGDIEREALVYLRDVRGIALKTWPASIRYANGLKHWDPITKAESFHPAIICALSRAPGGPVEAIGRIYLSDDGGKAALPQPKKTFAPTAGLAFWIGEPRRRLVIADGAEDAVAVHSAGEPFVCASLGVTNIPNIALPPDVKEVVIFADRVKDGPPGAYEGEAHIARARAKWEAAGVAVRIVLATGVDEKGNPNKDANDMLKSEGPEAVRRLIDGEVDAGTNGIALGERGEAADPRVQDAAAEENGAESFGPSNEEDAKPLDIAAELRELAAMDPITFAVSRKKHSERLGLTQTDLKKLVGEERKAIKARERARAKPKRRKKLAEIDLEVGEQDLAVDAVIRVIREHGVIFVHGGSLARVTPKGKVLRVDLQWLADYLSRHVDFYEWQNAKDGGVVRVRADPPTWLCARIASKVDDADLSALKGVITAPTMRLDGSILDAPGYDAETQLYLMPGDWPEIQMYPTRKELEAAWETLWAPYRQFPYATVNDRSATVAAILTAVMRRVLPTAPGFLFQAPVAGTGKTLLATCIALLCSPSVGLMSQCKEEDEMRKRLLAYGLEDIPSILLDNAKGEFKSSALEAFLTSEEFSDRVLGATESATVTTNILFLISGNNLVLRGDLYRRVLTARIDAGVEDVHRRTFDVDAKSYCTTRRLELAAAALTLLRGYLASTGDAAQRRNGGLASFEKWDVFIRQTVIWLGKEGFEELADPTLAIENTQADDVDHQRLAAFLELTDIAMKGAAWRVAELIERVNAAPVVDEEWSALKQLLCEISARDGGASINPRILGGWVKDKLDARCNGLRIQKAGTKWHTTLWQVVRERKK